MISGTHIDCGLYYYMDQSNVILIDYSKMVTFLAEIEAIVDR